MASSGPSSGGHDMTWPADRTKVDQHLRPKPEIFSFPAPENSKMTRKTIFISVNKQLVGGLEHFLFSISYVDYMWDVILPIDFQSIIFQRGWLKPPSRQTLRFPWVPQIKAGDICCFSGIGEARRFSVSPCVFSIGTAMASWRFWRFRKMGVPRNGWVIMDNPFKLDDLGYPPRFSKPPLWLTYTYTLYLYTCRMINMVYP